MTGSDGFCSRVFVSTKEALRSNSLRLCLARCIESWSVYFLGVVRSGGCEWIWRILVWTRITDSGLCENNIWSDSLLVWIPSTTVTELFLFTCHFCQKLLITTCVCLAPFIDEKQLSLWFRGSRFFTKPQAVYNDDCREQSEAQMSQTPPGGWLHYSSLVLPPPSFTGRNSNQTCKLKLSRVTVGNQVGFNG